MVIICFAYSIVYDHADWRLLTFGSVTELNVHNELYIDCPYELLKLNMMGY